MNALHRVVASDDVFVGGRTRNVMNIDARIGLYHDLEIYAYVPVVTSDSHEMAYAAGIGPGNSTIFPAYDKDVLFRLPYTSTKRAGLGDITLGLRWAPYNFYRDDTSPTVVMGVESVLPSGT